MKGRALLTGTAIVLIPCVVFAGFLVYCWQASHEHGLADAADLWHPAVRPGRLSQAHAHLENDCKACHTPIVGATPAKCILCHANDASVLQRQPTAFHADIGSCRECHIEHQGLSERPTAMEHGALARIGLRQLRENPDPRSDDRAALKRLESWIRYDGIDRAAAAPGLSHLESMLDCAACHGNDDRHFGLFGNDCAACHSAAMWTIPEFSHPPASSLDCAQCHQAPPSHYMMHFKMISQKVAGQPHADVEQCYRCHQTTSWPDIRGAGWYKHH